MQLERLDEIFAKSNENFQMIKFCLDALNDLDKKKF
jgi:hypothetical protein